MAATNNGHLPNMEEGEDKPMLLIKKSGDSPGITALINRQFQEACDGKKIVKEDTKEWLLVLDMSCVNVAAYPEVDCSTAQMLAIVLLRKYVTVLKEDSYISPQIFLSAITWPINHGDADKKMAGKQRKLASVFITEMINETVLWWHMKTFGTSTLRKGMRLCTFYT
ncbi:hypothetical protein RUM43_010316 [Polyplax serrata]|uniref:Uncharacterized protein n=1 Tax=Polyplax serrata TaxID=468196 RepID=A0AAN8S4T0_POLSC